MIHIKDDYYIGADVSNYTLEKKTVVIEESGEEKVTFKTIGYYSSIPFALWAYTTRVMREIVDGNDYELSEAVQAFKKIETELSELFDKLKGEVI